MQANIDDDGNCPNCGQPMRLSESNSESNAAGQAGGGGKAPPSQEGHGPGLAPAAPKEKDWRSLVRDAKPLLLRAWEKSGEGAFGPIAQALAHLDSALSGTPVSARAAIIEECALVLDRKHDELSKRSYPPPSILRDMATEVRALASTAKKEGE